MRTVKCSVLTQVLHVVQEAFGQCYQAQGEVSAIKLVKLNNHMKNSLIFLLRNECTHPRI